jgi:preprotein translocase YajC subunit
MFNFRWANPPCPLWGNVLRYCHERRKFRPVFCRRAVFGSSRDCEFAGEGKQLSWDTLSANGLHRAEGLVLDSWGLLAVAKKAQDPPIPFWVLFIVLGVAFFLIMIRPQRREQAQMANLLKNLKQNDKVVTIGGIHGTVVSASSDSDIVVLRIDENCKMRMTRSAIARLVEPNDKKGGKKG